MEANARNHHTPIEWAEKGVRKEDQKRPWLRRMANKNAYGVYFIFKSMEQGPSFRISVPKYPTQDPHHPRNLRNERWVRFNRIERQAEIDNNAASRGLDLNAGAADLLGAAMDADPHVISALRASAEPPRELSYDNEHRSARVIDSGVFSTPPRCTR